MDEGSLISWGVPSGQSAKAASPLPKPSTTALESPFQRPSGLSQPGSSLPEVNHLSPGVFLGSWAPAHSLRVLPALCCSSGLPAAKQSLGTELCGKPMLPPILSRAVLGQVQPDRFWQPQRSESGPVGEAQGQIQLRGRQHGLLARDSGVLREGSGGREGKGKEREISHLGRYMSKGLRPCHLLRCCRGCLSIRYRHHIPDQDLGL